VLAFMNGVGDDCKFHASVGQDTLNGLYLMVHRSTGGRARRGRFLFCSARTQRVGAHPRIGAGLMACMGGIPLAVVNTWEAGRFSLFTPSPLLSIALIIFLMTPFARKLIQDWATAKMDLATARKLVEGQTIAVVN